MRILDREEDLDQILGESHKTIVMFSAEWCGPCKVIAPEFAKLNSKNINTAKVDVIKFENLFDKHAINSLPTFILFEDRKEIERFPGSAGFESVKKLFK